MFCYNLPTVADENVALFEDVYYESKFRLADRIQSVEWMDTGIDLKFTQNDDEVTITTEPFCYGRNLVVRVAKIICE